MFIRYLTCMVGAGWSVNPGDTRDVPDIEAVRFIDAGFAEPAKAPDEIETAVVTVPAEKPERPARKAKR